MRTSGAPGQLRGVEDRLRTPQILPGAPHSVGSDLRFSAVPRTCHGSPGWQGDLSWQDGSHPDFPSFSR